MSTPPLMECADRADDLLRLREAIPRYTRAGVLRRAALPDGGVEFVEVLTDRVVARFDGHGRLVA
jgi:hypothetical protein